MTPNPPVTSRFRGPGIALLAGLLASAAAAQAPLTLADALREARANSDETRLIAETTVKLDAMKRELWAGALPQISAYADAGRGAQPFDPNAAGFPGEVVNPALNRFSYGIQGTQPLYSFGRLGQSFRTAAKQIAAQEEANRRALQELDLQALDAFYGALIAEKRLAVLKASIERQARSVAFLEANMRGGAGSRGTVLLATASLRALEPERIRAESDAAASRMTLNRLLGREIDAPMELDTTQTPEFFVMTADIPEGDVRNVLESRPDLASLRLQKETMRGYATAYRMQYLPSLGLQGRVGITAYELDDQLTDFDRNLDWQIGVGFSWPLFDGFSMSSKARQYDSDARTLAVTERRARDMARIEIETARREARAADAALEAARQSRDASAEALELLTRDFRAGAGQVTDLLSAEEGLRNAELALLAAGYQKARAHAALRVALGTDLIGEVSK